MFDNDTSYNNLARPHMPKTHTDAVARFFPSLMVDTRQPAGEAMAVMKLMILS